MVEGGTVSVTRDALGRRSTFAAAKQGDIIPYRSFPVGFHDITCVRLVRDMDANCSCAPLIGDANGPVVVLAVLRPNENRWRASRVVVLTSEGPKFCFRFEENA